MYPFAVSSIRRRACSTLALLRPFGPFFFGGCRYAHLIETFLQGPHGSSPLHRTFRFLQQSQARRSGLAGSLALVVASTAVAASDVEAEGCCCVSKAISWLPEASDVMPELRVLSQDSRFRHRTRVAHL
jgi:hypothetical protein